VATAFENLAPRVVGDLIRELGLLPVQAAGIVGNLGVESGLLAIQEKNPTSGRGGFGWAQWTGDRRVEFENFAKARGLDITSYEANLAFLVHELKTTRAKSLAKLKLTSTVKAAAETFGYWFERFAGFENLQSPNYRRRIELAERALELYKAKTAPVSTVVPVPAPVPLPPVTPTPVPSPPPPPPPPPTMRLPNIDPTAQPSIPFYKSKVLWGLIISIVFKLVWVWFKWAPPVGFDVAELVREVSVLASFVGDAVAWHGRVTATAEPVTFINHDSEPNPGDDTDAGDGHG
jgi:hypothetical protein